MRVHVERCWNGRTLRFMLTIPNGLRLIVGDAWAGWTRKTASSALDLIETETGANRRSIRFVHA